MCNVRYHIKGKVQGLPAIVPNVAAAPFCLVIFVIIKDNKIWNPTKGVNDIATVEIRNKLSVGDKLEVMIPNVLKPYEMTIEKLYDYETGEEIETVNPGVKEQKVKFKIGTDVKSGYIIRRVKNV